MSFKLLAISIHPVQEEKALVSGCRTQANQIEYSIGSNSSGVFVSLRF